MTPDRDFETAQETATRLGVTVRAIQKWASSGKIPGAVKHGRSWMIPKGISMADISENESAEPAANQPNGIPDVYQITPFRMAMPLLNSDFPIGGAMDYINALPDADDRAIALSEYFYFSGRAEEAVITAEPYLDSHDPALRCSASLICSFANLTRGHIHLARFAMQNLHAQVSAGLKSDAPPLFHAIGIFIATTASVLLHRPLPAIPPLEKHLHLLPGGLKLFGCYILAHKAYLEKNYEKSLTIAELGIALSPKTFPIAAIYTHMAAAMALSNMKRMDEAKEHIDAAWKLAQPDGLLEAFGEHHGLLQGLIEVYFKKNAPDVLESILNITYAYSAGWRMIHNPDTGHDVADNLTTMEFTIAMLFNRGWTVKEIAAHMEISERTVNRHVTSVYNKLGISDRNMLGQFMLI